MPEQDYPEQDYSRLYEDDTPAPAAEQPKAASQPRADPDSAAGLRSLESRFGPITPAAKPAAKPAAQPQVAHDAQPDPHRPATNFAAAGQPTEGEEPTWGETLGSAARNIVPSTGGVLKSMADSVIHPADTASAIGSVAKGAYSQAKGALGLPHDVNDEKLVSALEDHYKQVYGSTRGFKTALAKDPASIALDASTLLGGAGAGAKAAGFAGTAGALAKTASAVDPIANAMRVAKVATTPLKAGTRYIGATSGVSPYLQKVAASAGSTTDKAKRAAYDMFASGKGDNADADAIYLQTAQRAVGKARDAASNDYLATKAEVADNQIDLSGVLTKVDDLEKGLQKGSASGWPEAKKAATDARSMIEDVATHPDPAKRSLDEVDALKQQIWDLHDSYPNGSKAQAHLKGVYHAVGDALRDEDAGGDATYAKLMDNYQSTRLQLQNQMKTLGTGKTAAATASMLKGIKAAKTGAGQSMLSELSQHEPTLPYMLAGKAANPLAKGWGAAAADAAGGAFTASLFGLHPAAGLPLALASSPRIVAGLNRYGGAASRYFGKVPKRALTYAGQAEQAANPGQGVKPYEVAPNFMEDIKKLGGQYQAEQPANPGQGMKPDEVAPNFMEDIKKLGGQYQNDAQDQTDAYFKRMQKQESGNKQTDTQGNLVTSPKGAIGAAQIMPKYGPDIAAAAGEKWDENRARTDPEYNRKLGRGYYGALVNRFGDHDLAAAAYNAGPGAVIKAIASAHKTGRPYTDFLPEETKNYISSVRGEHAAGGRVSRASGGRINGALHERLVRRLMALAVSAKKDSDKVTEPLLKSPDEHIVKALDVAQRAI